MHLFDAFKRNKEFKFVSPIKGRVMPITEAPDHVFSQKMMGDGIAIDPSSGEVHSPVDGTIIMTFPTNHAIGIRGKDGKEILIHFGLDTVNLKGEGLNILVSEGDKVKIGDKILVADIDLIKGRVPSLITPIVFTNLEDEEIKVLKIGDINALDEDIIEITKR